MKEMRRKEKEITSKEDLIQILKNTQYVTIAMCQHNVPYLVTLTHGYDNKKHALYVHCAKEGKKMDILQENNVVWGQALIDKGYVQGSCDHLYTTVQFNGMVTFINDLKEKKYALETMIHQQEPMPTSVIQKQITQESLRNVTIGRIDITYLSGKTSDTVIIP